MVNRPVSQFSPNVFVALDFLSERTKRIESELQSKDVIQVFFNGA